MRNPWAWLVDRFAMKASPIACATPHAWVAEQRQAAEWALADKAPSYGGKFYSGDGAKGVMAGWGEEEMIKAFKAVALGLSLLLESVSVCYAQDLQKGLAALKRKDYAAALREIHPLSENGNSVAQKYLGAMYGDGLGVTQDYKEAVKWYRLSAEQGDALSQSVLGFYFRIGRGVTQDHKESVKWYRLSAEQGNADAQNYLAVIYFSGEGVIQDNVYAHMWWNIAASEGNLTAAGDRDAVAAMMTKAEISKAQDLARECVKKNYKGC